MRIVKLAAGLAVGYVLGAKAGRAKYEQIAATARKVSENPTVVQARAKAMSLMATGTDAATRPANTGVTPAGATPRPRPPRVQPVDNVTAPAVSGDRLV
jgi:hypothetical protein